MKDVPAKIGDLVIHRLRRGDYVVAEVWCVSGRVPSLIGWGDTFTSQFTRRNTWIVVREALKPTAAELIGQRFGTVRKAESAVRGHCPDQKLFSAIGGKRKRDQRDQ